MRVQVWAGRAMTAVAVLFLLFDSVIHILRIGPVLDAFAQLGVPDRLSVPLGTLELVLLAVYVFPRTAALGALLWTGYLGGAIAIQLRADQAAFPLLFPVFIALLLWGGLYPRDARVRALARV